MQQSYVYILLCSDGTYYTGVTSKLEQRLFQHESGFYQECYTFKRRPVQLVFYCEFTDINFAIDKEKQIKKWSKAKKLALINGEYDALPNLAKKKFK
ncbi:MAG: GIY-YIG nuclease family protein [Bacteroidetes bacterium]|uniref:GIY-YIG nuclease family protein n=1 Tax=Flavobacterium sp. TaxID=239 RepID=UPI002FD96AC3|nr:GIY-YIG nuclease family protein [Bacteroidota bacterium]